MSSLTEPNNTKPTEQVPPESGSSFSLADPSPVTEQKQDSDHPAGNPEEKDSKQSSDLKSSSTPTLSFAADSVLKPTVVSSHSSESKSNLTDLASNNGVMYDAMTYFVFFTLLSELTVTQHFPFL